MIYVPVLNYADGNLEPARAHDEPQGRACPASPTAAPTSAPSATARFPTTLLTYWTRDRTPRPEAAAGAGRSACRPATPPAPSASTTAASLQPGYRADLNVIDYDNLTLHAPGGRLRPAGRRRRLLQRASGYTATVVAGEVTYRDGEATDALPGRLLRGGAARADGRGGGIGCRASTTSRCR